MKSILAAIVAAVALGAAAATLDLEAAAERVKERFDGRVLGGKTVTEEGRTVYVIRVLTPDGRVRHIRVDAQSGEILEEPRK